MTAVPIGIRSGLALGVHLAFQCGENGKKENRDRHAMAELKTGLIVLKRTERERDRRGARGDANNQPKAPSEQNGSNQS